jgi:uncharacterized membrane protein YidH (DUF202 family)
MGIFSRHVKPNGHDPSFNVRELFDAGMLRQDDLRKQDRRHARELRKGESSRINAILAASALALQQAALAARAEAGTLAATVATTAETLRGQVEATKNAFATSITTVVTPITKRLDELTQTQYQQQGERLAYAEGKDTNQWIISSVILGGAVLLGAGALLLYRQQGQRAGRNDTRGTNQWYITTAVAVVVAVATLTLALSGHLK